MRESLRRVGMPLDSLKRATRTDLIATRAENEDRRARESADMASHFRKGVTFSASTSL